MKHYGNQHLHILFSFAVFAFLFVHLTLASDSYDTITVCDGKSASFSWPCDHPYDLAKVMTLTFKGLSTKGQNVATIDGSGSVSMSAEYSSRVTARGTTAVRLDDISILDSGVYLTTATFANGTVLKRHFTLNVQVPPLLKENRVRMAVHITSPRCQSISCGHLKFPGFPSVSFHWQTPRGMHSQSQSTTEGMSVIQGCPLLPGNYTCWVSGSALACGKHFPVSGGRPSLSAFVMLPAAAVEDTAAKSTAKETEEMVLIIVVPIVVVLTPLLILGLWLLSHLLSGRSLSCRSDNTEGGFSTSSMASLTDGGQPVPVCPSSSSPDTGPVFSDEPNGREKRQEDVKENPDSEEDADVADPTVPLVVSGSYSGISLSDYGDDGDTNL